MCLLPLSAFSTRYVSFTRKMFLFSIPDRFVIPPTWPQHLSSFQNYMPNICHMWFARSLSSSCPGKVCVFSGLFHFGILFLRCFWIFARDISTRKHTLNRKQKEVSLWFSLEEFLPFGLGLALEKLSFSWIDKLTSSRGSEIFYTEGGDTLAQVA